MIQTLQKKVFSERQQSFGPEDQITVHIRREDVKLISGKNSYIRCLFTLSEDSQAKCSLDPQAGGGFALFSRVSIWSNGTLIENCEDIGVYMGTSNFYDTTGGVGGGGLRGQRNVLEGLTNNDGTQAATPFSPYYNMLPCDGELNEQQVELILPMRFSSVMYGRVWANAVAPLEIRFLLNNSRRALVADLCDGMVVTRSRQGTVPSVCDLPFTNAQVTTTADFTNPTNGFPIVGPVPQLLPHLWQMQDGTGEPNLTVGADLMADIVAPAPATCDPANTGVIATTTLGTGLGCTLNVTIVGTVITALTVAVAGTGYIVGDTITIAQALLGAATVGDLNLLLVAADFSPPVGGFTTINVLTVAGPDPAGVFQGTLAGATPSNLHSNVLATPGTFSSMNGQSFYGLADDGTIVNFGEIAGVDAASNPNFIQVTLADPYTGTETFSPANNCSCFGAVLDPNLVAPGTGQSCSFVVDDFQLILEEVQEQGYVAAAIKKAMSNGGMSVDLFSYNVLKQNLFKNQTVAQHLLPTTSYRAKALWQHQQIAIENLNSSYYQPVSDYLRSYQYLIKSANTPNRFVECDKEWDPASNTFNVLLDHERHKMLRASGIKVRREVHPSARPVFGRSLAGAGFSFDANKNETRLTQNFGLSLNTGGGTTQLVNAQHDKQLLTLVKHYRKITVQGDNVVVSY